MKLNSPKEITDRKQAEIIKDIARTKEVKEELNKAIKELEETDAKFKLALSNQRVRWAKEEEQALDELNKIKIEIEVSERKKKEMFVPIEEREEKSHNLFIEAERTYQNARHELHLSEQAKEKNEEMSTLLQEKIDDISDRETDLALREQKVIVREKAVEEERAQIKNLSSELSIKLTNLK